MHGKRPYGREETSRAGGGRGNASDRALVRGGAAENANYRYYAVMDGKCEDLVVDENHHERTCVDKLVNVDFGDGRVSFTFGAATGDGLVTTEFKGGESFQSSTRSYVLYVDALIENVRRRPQRAPHRVRARERCLYDGRRSHDRNRRLQMLGEQQERPDQRALQERGPSPGRSRPDQRRHAAPWMKRLASRVAFGLPGRALPS